MMDDAAQSYVEIDFQADPRVLAIQSSQESNAIRSVDKYGVDHQEFWDVPFMIKILQGLKESKRGSELVDWIYCHP